ncbi:S-layer homology domain-containing protein [Oceanobacillus halotolerans]|uniref:S-layer homology domain-containing protein n=1 Tax=Oceanobacillus halotolerans TaxID=2663380 RepID=UPI0013DD697C|nr:S-layer homology domain-containing protein [Oceanobacillus halotolerans]
MDDTLKKCGIIVVAILSYVLLFSSSAAATTIFPDLKKVPWAEEEINYLYDQEVVKGLPDGSFGVFDNINRSDASLMLARAKNLDTNNIPKNSLFPDVDESAYYFEAVQAAVEAGYLNGYPNGDFGPKDTLTREQMAKIIAESFDLEEGNGQYFDDISNSWAKDFINTIAANGISNGTGDGSFKPSNSISRAEFSVMLARGMNDDYKVEPAPEDGDSSSDQPLEDNSRTNPANIGDIVTVEHEDWLDGYQKYEIELKESISGNEAWEIIRNANIFNDPPEPGMKYVLAKFRIKVLDLEEEPYNINHAKFDAVSKDGVKYDNWVSVSGLSPNLRTDIYTGGEHEGWTYFMVDETDEPLAVFNQSGDDEVWFDISN